MRRTVTVRGPLLIEVLGDPGEEPPLAGWQIECSGPGDGPATHCPVCGRKIAVDHLEHHLDCYDRDANCSVADVAAWFGIDRAREQPVKHDDRS